MSTTSFDPNRSVATLTMGELETFIRATISQSISSQTDNLIPTERDLNAPFDVTAPSFLDIIEGHLANVPEEAWEEVPSDTAKNFKGSLGITPRTVSCYTITIWR
ncbi:MAG: hypothetical protein GC158_10270 [Cyanobacteria bacterium RI_101]|nr:hypothetical protein [Cyanobacteria bacterium RI_101]